MHIAWKYLYTAKDSWLGAEANLGAIGAMYNLTMDPYEKYDMTFNGAAPARVLTTSPGRYAGQDNGWVLALIEPVILDFDKSIMKYPNIRRFPGGASNDLMPDLQHPENPLPILKDQKEPHVGGGRRLIRGYRQKRGGWLRPPPFPSRRRRHDEGIRYDIRRRCRMADAASAGSCWSLRLRSAMPPRPAPTRRRRPACRRRTA